MTNFAKDTHLSHRRGSHRDDCLSFADKCNQHEPDNTALFATGVTSGVTRMSTISISTLLMIATAGYLLL